MKKPFKKGDWTINWPHKLDSLIEFLLSTTILKKINSIYVKDYKVQGIFEALEKYNDYQIFRYLKSLA